MTDTPQTLAFSDPEQGAQALDALRALLGDLSPEFVMEALRDCSDPLKGVVGLVRFLERSLSPQTQAAMLASSPRYAGMLVTLFSQSRLLTDILCRNPEYASWLWDGAVMDTARPVADMLADVWGMMRAEGDFAKRCAILRRFSRRAVLRIAAREIWMHAPFPSIGEDLSNLADTALETALRMAAEQLAPRFGAPMGEPSDGTGPSPAKFAVLGMGKLGGRELNFSSDIDLLFIYSDPGRTTGGSSGSVTNEEYYKRFGELVIKAVSEQTAEGLVFRVDMRLRPFGKSGPLAVSFDAALDYYMNYGRAWERQALIKSRPCAGDLDLGEALLEKLRPFIFPRYFDDATLEDIRQVKSQTEARTAERGESEREVKLGRGGIRDIEFTVQMLQLLNGGRWPDLRTRNTLEAVTALGERQSLSPFEAAALSRHYVFLRQAEHRLQIEGGHQVHALPEKPDDLDEFARRLGYANGESFMRVYREHTADTRRILEKFLSTKGAGNLWVMELLDPKSAAETGMEKLREAGFTKPEQARAELLLLANGPEGAPHTRDVAAQFAAVTPSLLAAFAALPGPENGLMRLGQIIGRLHSPGTLYELLRVNPGLCRCLATLIANSEYLCSILVRDISLLDLVGSPSALAEASTRESLRGELDALDSAALPEAAPFRLRDGEMLKVSMRELMLGISVAEVGDELTLLAEVILEHALDMARAQVEGRYGINPRRFAILALGKFGGREMGYGSDLDLVFVHEDEETAPGPCSLSDTEYFPAIASIVLKHLKEPTRFGLLYDIDARLRPDGSKGVLSITERRLRQYYTEEAHPWERFALMKARAVAGDDEFRARIGVTAREIAFSAPPDMDALNQIETLRLKTAQSASALDLKRHEGGLSEVEFTTRFLQLRHVAEHPELRHGGVFRALALLCERGLAPEEDCATLAEAYGFYRKIVNRVRMMRGNSTSRMPEDAETRLQLAARLGMEGDPLDAVDVMRGRVSALYRKTLAEEMDRAGRG